jgi:hypothetical protein
MIPPFIVDEALARGLNLIAVTDHNAIGNAAAVMEAAAGTDLHVLPGMEFQAQEEVELLCIFETLEQASAWQDIVTDHLLPRENDPERFGPQFLVDAEGDFVAEDMHFYQGAARISLSEAAHKVKELGGLIIPAHIDRPTKGLLGVLGLWPPDLEADAAALSCNLRPSQARERFPFLPNIPLIANSDAHWLDAIGTTMTLFEIAAPTIAELRLAFRGEGKRRTYVP